MASTNVNPYREPPAHGPCETCMYWVQLCGESNGACVQQGPSWLSNVRESQVITAAGGGQGCDVYKKRTP